MISHQQMNNDEDDENVSETKRVKDPRIRARKYQLELCKRAVKENIIVYLGTGCGKTHIAVLLIHELGHLIRKPKKDVCIFLAPTIPLVRQQASVIEESTDFKVGSYYGHSKHVKNHQEWEKELEEYEVLVMTPQILLHTLLHRLIKMELITLLIFDECHHAQAQSSHPYAQIMKEIKTNTTKRPRIFGMTASPIVGKGGANLDDLPRSINSLENLLDAKVCSVKDSEELERFVSSPETKVYHYGPSSDCTVKSIYHEKLEEIKNQCIQILRRTTEDVKVIQNNRKVLQRLQDNLLFCLESLGLWGAVQAVRILVTGDQAELINIIDIEGHSTDNLANHYLSQAASVVDSDFIRDQIEFDSSVMETLKDPIFSKKLLVLIQILSSYRIQSDMKCIVFVNRIILARTLSWILSNLKCLPFWKCHFLVGYHSGLKNMSRKAMSSIVEKFRSGELNLLVATPVGEEGLDIQTCCLVIRFDLPLTVGSFIQSRGRARMPQSEYAFLVERGNQSELDLLNNFLLEEERMNKEIQNRTSGETFDGFEEAYYRVPSTGACISAGYSVSLLHHYCSKLPHDEYYTPKPNFFYFEDNKGGIVCRIILPSNAPIHQVDSPTLSSKEKARKVACLKACEKLHFLGSLTDHLLPVQDDELDEELIDSETLEDESTRGELHEMLSPSVLKHSWDKSDNCVLLNFYFIQFCPIPNDRQYQKFGLFVKEPLPREAETMELDLHLAHGRIVKSKLVPLGVMECGTFEIIQAQSFQELFLKIILDREDFFADFVQLGRTDSSQSNPSTFYLLLPVRQSVDEESLVVDWKLIKRCLSSPVFEAQKDKLSSGLATDGNSLILVDGLANTSDIVNSLIFTPHNKLFFFVDGIFSELNAESPFTDHSSVNYVDHYAHKFGISILHPKQPLLRAKQLFSLHNLLHNRVQRNTEARELEEHFVELPPELCSLKIIGFSKDIGSSLSLLPSLMCRLENLLIAIELKSRFSHSFPEGSEVTAQRILEALTTEKCMERFSLERLEVLGDAFLKYAVGRHVFLLHETVDEGQLTRKRSSIVNNNNLYKLAIRSNLQVYIRDENFDPSQFFAFGRPCTVICDENTEMSIHFQQRDIKNGVDSSNVKCNKGHHWLHKKTVADVVEALVGAFIVDSGFEAAIAFLEWIGIKLDFEASQVSELCVASKSYLPLSSNIDTSALEESLGYTFLHKGLLVQAFVHPSYNKHIGGCYQRLEFLGDAVLDYLITSYLFSVYPKLKPGQLTDLRSVTVNNNAFARIAVLRSFHKHLISDSDSLSEAVQKFVSFLHSSPAAQIVEGPRCPKALGDLVESIIGAVLLDTGFNLNPVWKIMLSFLDSMMSFSSLQLNPVRELTELCQSHNWDFNMSNTKNGGQFLVNASVTGSSVHSTGQGINVNKKAAMRMAAREIFLKLKAQGYGPKKSKNVGSLLKSGKKHEARLIGYNETPVPVPAPTALFDEIQLENLMIQEPANTYPFSRQYVPTPQTLREQQSNKISQTTVFNNYENGGPYRSSKSKWHPGPSRSSNFLPGPSRSSKLGFMEVGGPSGSSKLHEGPSGSSSKFVGSSGSSSKSHGDLPKSSKVQLLEACQANHWDLPVFKLVKEEGPSHLKSFVIRVFIEFEVNGRKKKLEVEGHPQPKKKAAEECAAEGAFWFLRRSGVLKMKN